jgi:DNA-binding transcriptional ArsR family regulator
VDQDQAIDHLEADQAEHVEGTSDGEAVVPHPLPAPLVELIARRFRVLGEPTRIKLLDLLREHDATVTELHEELGASQQNVSKHLGVLLQAGIVRRTKHGTSARYAIADDGVFELCENVCGGLRRQVAELDALLPVGSER